jgi:hypothetical protein
MIDKSCKNTLNHLEPWLLPSFDGHLGRIHETELQFIDNSTNAMGESPDQSALKNSPSRVVDCSLKPDKTC